MTLVEILVGAAVLSVFVAGALGTVAAAARLEREAADRGETRGAVQQAAHQFALDVRLATLVMSPEPQDCPVPVQGNTGGKVLAVQSQTGRIAYCLQGGALFRRQNGGALRLAGGLDVAESFLGAVDKTTKDCRRLNPSGNKKETLCLLLVPADSPASRVLTAAYLRG